MALSLIEPQVRHNIEPLFVRSSWRGKWLPLQRLRPTSSSKSELLISSTVLYLQRPASPTESALHAGTFSQLLQLL